MGDTPSMSSTFLQSLRRRWMDATLSGTSMPSSLHQHGSPPGTALSGTTPQPNSLQQQDDQSPGAKLPVECIEQIVSHIEDLWTLWSLLTVNKRFAAVVLRRLYANPYRSILLGFLFHEGIPIRRLAQRILTLTHVNPSDPYIQSMKRVLKIQDAALPRLQPGHSNWIDYLALIREVEWPTDIWEELHEFFHEVGTEMAKDPLLRRESAQAIEAEDPRWSCTPALVQSTLTWAACGGSAEQLGRIKKLWIPIQDIERYLDSNVIAQLTQLEEVVFDVRYASIKTDFEATFQNGISFVRAHRHYHLPQGSHSRTQGGMLGNSGGGSGSGARLDSVRFERLSWRGYEHLERELYSLLPPINKPKHLTKENWDRFIVKPQETDTSRLESIFYDEPDKVDWGPYLPEIPSFLLPTCRRLVRLRLRVRAKEATTIFQWAVEEKKKSSRRKVLAGESHEHEDDSLVRLEELDLTCDRGTMERVIQDTTFAFGHSLRVLNVMPTMEDIEDIYSETASIDDLLDVQAGASMNGNNGEIGEALGEHGQGGSSLQCGSSSKLCIGAGWNLPRLVRLSIVSIGPRIELDPKALAHSRRLELVRLRDDTAIHVTPGQSAQSIMQSPYDEWVLPSATRIKLIGHPARKFNPASLTWMKRLTWLELSQQAVVTMAGSSASDSPPTPSSISPSPSVLALSPSIPCVTKNPWTWDWDLPNLQSLILVGESAVLFELKFLQHTPNLRALSLDINRIERDFVWTLQSNVSAPHLEELCLTGRWSISKETLQYILLGSAESCSPSESTTSTRTGSPSSPEEPPSKIEACEQRRPRTLRNVRCSHAVSIPEARKMGLDLLDPNSLVYSNPYLQDAISYHTWTTYHSRSQGLLSMLSSPTSQQQPANCVKFSSLRLCSPPPITSPIHRAHAFWFKTFAQITMEMTDVAQTGEQPAAAPAGASTFAGAYRPTVKDIQNDAISALADRWNKEEGEEAEWDAKLVESIYEDELLKHGFSINRLAILEINQYLEKYLWVHYDPVESSTNHVLSIVLMVNEKFRSRVPAWETFEKQPVNFQSFFQEVLRLSTDQELSLRTRRILLVFMINCFQSLENVLVRTECMRLVSLSTWHNLISQARREEEFKENTQLLKFWNHLEKKFNSQDDTQKKRAIFERSWLSMMIKQYFAILESSLDNEDSSERIAYCERFMELMIDLEAQLPTRRYFNTLLDDHQVVAFCKLSKLAGDKEKGTLFSQLLEILEFYAGFEINSFTGMALTKEDMIEAHSTQLTKLQRLAFSEFQDELMDLAMSNLASIEQRTVLQEHFDTLSDERLKHLCHLLHIRTEQLIHEVPNSRDLLMECLLLKFEKRHSQIDRINAMPLYPDENALFEDAAVQEENYDTDRPLALPKLNLQFLTLHDYLLRNFNLFRLESNYEIRQDIEDAVKRLGPRPADSERATQFTGWSRNAAPISHFEINKVAKPELGEDKPALVTADVTFNVRRYTDAIQAEWEAVREHDVLFLLTIQAHDDTAEAWDGKTSFRRHYGLKYVRGCEVVNIIGPNGRPLDNKKDPKLIQEHRQGNTRTFRVALDANQFKIDQEAARKHGGEDVYQTFNVLLRRKPQENNFKPVLETIRDLMQSELMVPEWLHNVFLGYGNPDCAHYSQLPGQIKEIDFRDTFLDYEHLKESFPTKEVKPAEGFSEESLQVPFIVKFPDATKDSAAAPAKKRKAGGEKGKKSKSKKKVEQDEDMEEDPADKPLEIKTYTTPNMGPYPEDIPKRNQVRFTPTQVEAIKAGTNPGLTLVVGPPGTGKTDVAVQVIANLYNNFPNQHTLLVTHSNQALNQLFEKIIALDVDERHLLRLGHGEEELNTELSFSKYGRVTSFLEKRVALLAEVDRLAQSLAIGGEHGATCETAGYFYSYHVVPLWEAFQAQAGVTDERDEEDASEQDEDADKMKAIQEAFPFHGFFSNAPVALFSDCTNVGEVREAARGCFRHLVKLFEQLEEVSAFELLRTSYDRANYLLTKEAKIIAMTCTHAALKRRELVQLGFKYDNIVMEEAAQILEVETFIPMLLQEPEEGHQNRLKRVILIGDHNQLPPVVKNTAFQQYGNMEQSMFTRFVRLGVPVIELDAQGRTRSDMAALYKWRYKNLGDLPNVLNNPEYKYANPGFVYDYQFINVDNYKGKGETAPRPHFIQNLGEAEYVVAVYQYMRLLGYPAEKISILTTYNGQKDLIRDVLRQRCSWNQALFGRPAAVTTVDKYQGQQNDFVLLSLVRTKAVGHIRDVRRLVVALSRARLGLYVFGRMKLFQNCHELEPALKQLLARPTNLWVQAGEMYPNTTRLIEGAASKDGQDEGEGEDEEEEEDSKAGKKGAKKGGKKAAKKAAAAKKKAAAKEEKDEDKAATKYEILTVEQMGQYVFGMMKEQQQYAIQQQQQYMQTMGLTVPEQPAGQDQQPQQDGEAPQDMEMAEESKEAEEDGTMEVDRD
ncbi:hypothetical protein BGZ73_001565 [Actinomortierella ambigua]|nr:hypothetical protein BGZ73_001565 [Actinomortierella ambigua]